MYQRRAGAGFHHGLLESAVMARKHTMRRRGADRRRLYELAVQDTAFEVTLAKRQFRRRRGRRARLLREDFCGTAAVACAWAADHAEHRAIGLDIDESALAWGREHHLAALGDAADRVDLRVRDVRTVTQPRADIVQAYNFSAYLFYPLPELVAYLRCVRRSLVPGGLVMLDGYGGWEAGQDVSDRRTIQSPDGSFGYVWEQASFNPIDNLATCHIHFEFRNGKVWKRAFSYHWRVYSPAELTDALLAAGFEHVEILWDVDDDPDRSDFRPATRAENCPGWLFYAVAEAPSPGG